MTMKRIIESYKFDAIAILVLIFLSMLHFLFAIRTDNYFSTDDFAVLSYIRDHNLLEIAKNFLLEGDLFGFRKVIGYLYFEALFEAFGVKAFYYNLGNFIIHTSNVIILYLTAKKISGNRFASFISAVIFNKIYLLYFSNIHEMLAALFILLSIYYYLDKKKLIISVLFFILALLTKEVAFVLPFVLIAVSILKKIPIKRTLNHFSILFVYGLYQLSFILSDQLLPKNESYQVSLEAKDLIDGLFYYFSPAVILFLSFLPTISKKFKSYLILLSAVLALLPVLFFVGRREVYYLYLPMTIVCLFLSVNLPKFSFKSMLLSVVLIFVFGGRSVFPNIARQKFPNWQKVSIENVTDRVEDSVSRGETEIYIGDINLERDAKLMLQNDLLDLFLIDEKQIGNTYQYLPGSQTIELERN